MEMLMPYLRTSPELSLLLRLMQGDADLPADIDRERLQTLICKNRLEPMAAERLTGAEQLSFDSDKAAMTTMRQISLLGYLAGKFAQQGIRVLSVKGPALAMEIYGTPGMRCYHDLDLLVELRQADQAAELLVQDGWTWYEQDVITTPKRKAAILKVQNHYLFSKGDLCVELHWRLLPWDCGAFEQLWAARRQTTLGGAELAVPGTVHQLHHLVYHGVRHGFHRMKWLADLAVLLPRHMEHMDELWQSLAQCGQEITLLMTWLLLLGLREMDIPDASFRGITMKRTNDGVLVSGPEKIGPMLKQAQKLLAALLPLMEDTGETEYSLQHCAYEKLLPRPQHLQGFMKGTIDRWRPRVILWQWIDLPDSLFWLYWPLRPVERLLRMLKRSSLTKKD